MIYLLYGEDTFSSRLKLEAIKRRFWDKYGVDNLVTRSGPELTNAILEDALFSQTLLGGKRLVVLKDVLSDADIAVKERLTQLLVSLPLDVTVVMHESQSFDARQKLFKLVNRPGYAQEFASLPPAALLRQTSKLATEKDIDISLILLRYLLDRTESDLWLINNELDKLAALSQGRPVVREDIDVLIPANIKANVFDLVERLIQNNLPVAHRILQTSLNQGEDEVRLLGALAYQLRNLIRVSDLKKQGLSAPAIAKQTGLPFFVVRRSLSSITRLDRRQLIEVYQKLVCTDHKIKTGISRPADALDLLIAQKI